MLDTIPTLEERREIHNKLIDLPENESVYKCYNCRTIFDIYDNIPVLMALIPRCEIRCPKCKLDKVELICKVDAYSLYLKLSGQTKCREGKLINGTDICPICHDAICPQCWNHSVVSWSRITGYLNDVNGWNEGKKQELMDRKRYMDLSNQIIT